METPTLLFIIVNYFNEGEVADFVAQLSKQPFTNYQVLVVNNGADNYNALRQIMENHSRCTLIPAAKNLGYLGGAALGLSHWQNQHKELPEYVLLCNTDIEFEVGHFFNQLSNIKADVIGPSIISSKSRIDQNPFFKNRVSKNKLRLLAWVYSFYPYYLVYQSCSILKTFWKGRFPSKNKSSLQEVYALHGSFIIFRNTFFAKGGNFSYGSFLYGEEIFIAEIARKNSMQVVYDPSLKIIHHEHSTTGTFKKPSHVKFMKQSISYLYKSFFSR